MTDKQTITDPITHAARLLRETAEELRHAHAYNNFEGRENETDAKAAYDEHMAAAQALEDWEAAVGAGGVQPLRSVQEGCKLVPLEPTQEMLAALMSPGEAEALASSPSETFALMLMDRAGIRERYSAMLVAAPQQEAQEPVAWLVTWVGGVHNYVQAHASELPAVDQGRRMAGTVTPLYTAPQPAPAPLIARSLAEWHEQDGNVAWWAWNGREWAGEPAWIGTPNCEDWPGYHTHWTPHPEQPVFAALAAQGGE